MVSAIKENLGQFCSQENTPGTRRVIAQRRRRLTTQADQSWDALVSPVPVGGNGVFLSRNETAGAWSEPAFFEMSSASFGLQAGVQSQEAILLVMSPKGVESLLTSTVKLGVDGSVAMGPKRIGAEGSTAPSLSTEFVTISRAKGLYVGLSLDGAMIRTRDELTAASYGETVRPPDIIIAHKVKHNPASKGLHNMLAKAIVAK
jgi:lipid-binding SYLF domain-containing protein